MSNYLDKRSGVMLGIAVICLLPLHLVTSATPARGSSQGFDCGSAQQGVDQLNANLGMDGGLANRAVSLANAAAKAGQPPAPQQLGNLITDSLDGLSDAGDQIDQAAGQVGQRLESLKLTRQGRVWAEGVKSMRSARTKLQSVIRKEPSLARQKIGSLSATGVGPTTTYEAADTYQQSVDNLGSIADQSNFQEIGQKNWIEQGKPDMAPPPNPLPDPLQEWLRRLRAQQMRIHNNVNGLNAARAMQGRQFQQAQQRTADMQRNMQQARSLANQLGQMLGPCSQQAQQHNANNNNGNGSGSANGAGIVKGQPVGNTGAAAAAASGGSHAGVIVGLGLAGAGAVGGYAIYKKAYPCGTAPVVTSNYSSCVTGYSINACNAAIQELDPFCRCVETHDATFPAGLCDDILNAVRDVQQTCNAYGGCRDPR